MFRLIDPEDLTLRQYFRRYIAQWHSREHPHQGGCPVMPKTEEDDDGTQEEEETITMPQNVPWRNESITNNVDNVEVGSSKPIAVIRVTHPLVRSLLARTSHSLVHPLGTTDIAPILIFPSSAAISGSGVSSSSRPGLRSLSSMLTLPPSGREGSGSGVVTEITLCPRVDESLLQAAQWTLHSAASSASLQLGQSRSSSDSETISSAAEGCSTFVFRFHEEARSSSLIGHRTVQYCTSARPWELVGVCPATDPHGGGGGTRSSHKTDSRKRPREAVDMDAAPQPSVLLYGSDRYLKLCARRLAAVWLAAVTTTTTTSRPMCWTERDVQVLFPALAPIAAECKHNPSSYKDSSDGGAANAVSIIAAIMDDAARFLPSSVLTVIRPSPPTATREGGGNEFPIGTTTWQYPTVSSVGDVEVPKGFGGNNTQTTGHIGARQIKREAQTGSIVKQEEAEDEDGTNGRESQMRLRMAPPKRVIPMVLSYRSLISEAQMNALMDAEAPVLAALLLGSQKTPNQLPCCGRRTAEKVPNAEWLDEETETGANTSTDDFCHSTTATWMRKDSLALDIATILFTKNGTLREDVCHFSPEIGHMLWTALREPLLQHAHFVMTTAAIEGANEMDNKDNKDNKDKRKSKKKQQEQQQWRRLPSLDQQLLFVAFLFHFVFCGDGPSVPPDTAHNEPQSSRKVRAIARFFFDTAARLLNQQQRRWTTHDPLNNSKTPSATEHDGQSAPSMPPQAMLRVIQSLYHSMAEHCSRWTVNDMMMAKSTSLVAFQDSIFDFLPEDLYRSFIADIAREEDDQQKESEDASADANGVSNNATAETVDTVGLMMNSVVPFSMTELFQANSGSPSLSSADRSHSSSSSVDSASSLSSSGSDNDDGDVQAEEGDRELDHPDRRPNGGIGARDSSSFPLPSASVVACSSSHALEIQSVESHSSSSSPLSAHSHKPFAPPVTGTSYHPNNNNNCASDGRSEEDASPLEMEVLTPTESDEDNEDSLSIASMESEEASDGGVSHHNQTRAEHREPVSSSGCRVMLRRRKQSGEWERVTDTAAVSDAWQTAMNERTLFTPQNNKSNLRDGSFSTLRGYVWCRGCGGVLTRSHRSIDQCPVLLARLLRLDLVAMHCDSSSPQTVLPQSLTSHKPAAQEHSNIRSNTQTNQRVNDRRDRKQRPLRSDTNGDRRPQQKTTGRRINDERPHDNNNPVRVARDKKEEEETPSAVVQQLLLVHRQAHVMRAERSRDAAWSELLQWVLAQPRGGGGEGPYTARQRQRILEKWLLRLDEAKRVQMNGSSSGSSTRGAAAQVSIRSAFDAFCRENGLDSAVVDAAYEIFHDKL